MAISVTASHTCLGGDDPTQPDLNFGDLGYEEAARVGMSFFYDGYALGGLVMELKCHFPETTYSSMEFSSDFGLIGSDESANQNTITVNVEVPTLEMSFVQGDMQPSEALSATKFDSSTEILASNTMFNAVVTPNQLIAPITIGQGRKLYVPAICEYGLIENGAMTDVKVTLLDWKEDWQLNEAYCKVPGSLGDYLNQQIMYDQSSFSWIFSFKAVAFYSNPSGTVGMSCTFRICEDESTDTLCDHFYKKLNSGQNCFGEDDVVGSSKRNKYETFANARLAYGNLILSYL